MDSVSSVGTRTAVARSLVGAASTQVPTAASIAMGGVGAVGAVGGAAAVPHLGCDRFSDVQYLLDLFRATDANPAALTQAGNAGHQRLCEFAKNTMRYWNTTLAKMDKGPTVGGYIDLCRMVAERTKEEFGEPSTPPPDDISIARHGGNVGQVPVTPGVLRGLADTSLETVAKRDELLQELLYKAKRIQSLRGKEADGVPRSQVEIKAVKEQCLVDAANDVKPLERAMHAIIDDGNRPWWMDAWVQPIEVAKMGLKPVTQRKLLGALASVAGRKALRTTDLHERYVTNRTTTLSEWLKSLKLGQYEAAMRSLGCCRLHEVLRLHGSQLRRLPGMLPLHRCRLVAAVERLRGREGPLLLGSIRAVLSKGVRVGALAQDDRLGGTVAHAGCFSTRGKHVGGRGSGRQSYLQLLDASYYAKAIRPLLAQWVMTWPPLVQVLQGRPLPRSPNPVVLCDHELPCTVRSLYRGG